MCNVMWFNVFLGKHFRMMFSRGAFLPTQKNITIFYARDGSESDGIPLTKMVHNITTAKLIQ